MYTRDTGLILGLPPANGRRCLLLCNDVSHWLGASLESTLIHVLSNAPKTPHSLPQKAQNGIYSVKSTLPTHCCFVWNIIILSTALI